MHFFPSFISNTSMVSINFRAKLDLRMQEMAFPCFKFQNFLGEYTPRPPPIHAWYIGHTRGLQPFLSPSDILSHRKVPFQKMPPHGKILKKGPALPNPRTDILWERDCFTLSTIGSLLTYIKMPPPELVFRSRLKRSKPGT